jgi:excinuclease ABC subunit C
MNFASETFCKNLTIKPGVYQMINNKGVVIYVGKAKNLKSRVSSYFNSSSKTTKIIQLVKNIREINIVQTNSELEALLLEHNLIKELKPKYNVIFKDDKTYPFIELTRSHDYPGLYFYRGTKKLTNQYFGPFPNSYAARNSIGIIQKTFKIRNCKESVFKNRTRPCLQHQIDRCTAPCVGYITKEDYRYDIARVTQFLQGKTRSIIEDISEAMLVAANEEKFERAAALRDQIIDLNEIIKKQIVSGQTGDFDVIGLAKGESTLCVTSMFFRNGRLIGSKNSLVDLTITTNIGDILEFYILKNYYDSNIGQIKKIYVGIILQNKSLIEHLVKTKTSKNFKLIKPIKSEAKKWVTLANDNAYQLLELKNLEAEKYSNQFNALEKELSFNDKIKKIECFDISHTSGASATASCVVFNSAGPVKNLYRKFNIANIIESDDYAALRQAFIRRYQRVLNEQLTLPDLIIIDGGKGHLKCIQSVADHLKIKTKIISISKGSKRKRGEEKIHFNGKLIPIVMNNPSGLLLQQIRDEAHRFAITSHRKRRDKQSAQTLLDDLPGIGPKRKRNLLKHFGSIKGIINASLEEISKVEGISTHIAMNIQKSLLVK